MIWKGGDESYGNSIIPPLGSEEEMDAIDSGDESDDEPMSMKMSEDIFDGIQYHPSINMREAHYKICDCIEQIQTE